MTRSYNYPDDLAKLLILIAGIGLSIMGVSALAIGALEWIAERGAL